MTPEERKALDVFVAALRKHYGKQLHDIVLYGSRARGDDSPDSDVDLAVILNDGDWRPFSELMVMAGMSYDALMRTGLFIQSIPIPLSSWESPAKQSNRTFLEAARCDARKLSAAA